MRFFLGEYVKNIIIKSTTLNVNTEISINYALQQLFHFSLIQDVFSNRTSIFWLPLFTAQYLKIEKKVDGISNL